VRKRLAGIVVSVVLLTPGCVSQPGARYSIWPTKPAPDATAIGGNSSADFNVTSKLSSTARGVKGQFASVGTAVTSAYDKAKTAVSSAFTTPTPGAAADATTLATGSASQAGLGPEMSVITGNMYESNGNYAKAMDFYSKALEAEPTNVAALTSMARLHDRQNSGEKAVEFYQKAISANPNQASLYVSLGEVQSRMGQVAVAKEQYQKAINLDPKNRAYRSSLAGILIDEGQAEKAEQELRNVDTPAMAQYQMAYLYMSKQNLALTKQHLGNALTLDPNLKPARDLMSSISSGAVQQASGLAQQANQLSQQSGQILQQANQLMGGTPHTATAPSNVTSY
jgi:tetratricopeptide (TPR) repeat protein